MNIFTTILLLTSAISVVASPNDSLINVNQLGVYGNEQMELSDTLQKILDTHARVYFPPGKYLIDKSLHLSSGHRLSGSDSTVFVAVGEATRTKQFSFFTAGGVQDIRLEQLTFYAEDQPERTVYAVSARNVHHLVLEQLTAYHAGIAEVQQLVDHGYTQVPDTLLSESFRRVGNSHITVNRCRGEGSQQGLPRHTTGVLIRYAYAWQVTNCTFTRYRHGVQWWGGDSNPKRDGALTKVRKCRDGVIANTRVTHVWQGGIWGSMGENITVENCQVTRCGDVGIDFEGCFYSRAINNYVQGGKNGNLAVFFYNRDVRFANNQSVQSDPQFPHARIYNATQRPENGQITFDNNVFVNTAGVGCIEQRGPSNRIVFTQNSLQNVVVNFNFNNNRFVEVQHNTFLITRPLLHYDYVLMAGQTHFGGEVLMAENHILSTVSQPDSVYAISLYQSDYNHAPTNRLVNNHVSGLAHYLRTEWAGKNAGFAAKTYVETERSLPPSAIRKVDSGARPSEVYVNGRKRKR